MSLEEAIVFEKEKLIEKSGQAGKLEQVVNG